MSAHKGLVEFSIFRPDTENEECTGGFMNRFLSFIVGTLLLTGCATYRTTINYDVDVNSICDHQYITGDSSYSGKCLLLPAERNTDIHDLEYKEYSMYVQRALISMGYTMVKKSEYPDVIVYLDFGVGEPKEHIETVSKPIYGQTGVSSSTTISDSLGGFYTTFTPSFGVVGSSSNTYSYETFTKYIRLMAYSTHEKEDDGKYVQLWKTNINNSDEESDLRDAYPNMLGAALPYIGTDTKRYISLTVNEEDEGVLIIKGWNKGKN